MVTGILLAADAAGLTAAKPLPAEPMAPAEPEPVRTTFALPPPLASPYMPRKAMKPVTAASGEGLAQADTLPPPRGSVVAPAIAQPPPDIRGATPGCSAARPSTLWQRCKLRLRACLGYPEDFDQPPLGHSVNQHYVIHVQNGEAARMVLYQYDFVGCTAVLNPRGKQQLAKMAAMLSHNPFPIVIEHTPYAPTLGEARRQAVMAELAQAPFPVPPERVVVGPPIANGLAGVEAERVYSNLLQRTQGGGALGGGGPQAGFVAPVVTPPQPPVQP
jgi:hypothetical protein